MAHITGGGFTDNVPRVLPKSVCAEIDASAWELPAVFKWIKQAGSIAADEMARTFNCGIGMVMVVAKADVDTVLKALAASGEQAYVVGQLKAASGAEQGTATPKRIAVVGSGLAGLTTAYLLQKSGCEVELFEKADSVGMDAGSLSVDGVRVDVPFRVFTPDYYPYLYSLYSHLGIEFAAADYSLGFADEHAASIWSYTNTTLDDFQMPIPDGIRRGHRLAVTRDWVRLVFACVKIMRVPALLRPGGYLDRLTIGEYLKREQYDPVFTDRVFIPFIASLLTCSLSAARMYPATTILHFVSKAVCGSRLRK
ncbi:hypothetical protein IWW51_005989, partial [Coemansia sp. RSA 2702]